MDTGKTDKRIADSEKAIKALTARVKSLEQEVSQLKKKSPGYGSFTVPKR